MPLAVLDAGVALGWIWRRHRSLTKINHLFESARSGRHELVLSTVNLAEVLIHTRTAARTWGGDPTLLLRNARVRFHAPDDAVARRVAMLPTSLADGFAAATAQVLGGRLHTADQELVRSLRRTRMPITVY